MTDHCTIIYLFAKYKTSLEVVACLIIFIFIITEAYAVLSIMCMLKYEIVWNLTKSKDNKKEATKPNRNIQEMGVYFTVNITR